VKTGERACQIWSVLALAARNRQVLTYDLVAQATGLARQGIGQFLEPIQSFCLIKKLPPLTVLVVSKITGLPSEGFTGASDYGRAQLDVFDFDWLKHGCPSAEQFAQAAAERPSRGPLAAGSSAV
jgi:hypothetical protein